MEGSPQGRNPRELRQKINLGHTRKDRECRAQPLITSIEADEVKWVGRVEPAAITKEPDSCASGTSNRTAVINDAKLCFLKKLLLKTATGTSTER